MVYSPPQGSAPLRGHDFESWGRGLAPTPPPPPPPNPPPPKKKKVKQKKKKKKEKLSKKRCSDMEIHSSTSNINDGMKNKILFYQDNSKSIWNM